MRYISFMGPSLIQLLFLLGFAFQAIWAQTTDIRQYSIQAADPLRDFEATAHAYMTVQQSIGLADDAIARQYNPSAHWPSRSMDILAVTYLNLAAGYYNHELGHDIIGPKLGNGKQWIGKPTAPTYMPWPQYYRTFEFNTCDIWCSAFDSLFNISSYSGLNMEEYSAQLLATKTHQYLSWDEALAYLFRRISPITYDLYSPDGFWPRKNKRGEWTMHLKSTVGDPAQYLINERSAGYSISYRDFYLRSLAPVLLTWRVHESIATVWDYLRGNSRGRTPWQLRWQNIELQTPLVSGYILAHGTLWDAQFLWKRASSTAWHQITLGTDADWIGSGKLSTFHIAFHNPLFQVALPWGRPLNASLAQSFTWKKQPLQWTGYEVRGNLRASLLENLSLQFTLAHTRNDVIRHDVLLESNGARASCALEGAL